MEILKIPVTDEIIKLDIGMELSDNQKEIVGSVELDIESQAYFIDVLNAIFDEGSKNIIVNMENITYIDSSGLWALFEGHKKAIQKSSKLLLLKPSKDVKRVLDITKMSSKLQIFNEETEAIESLA